MACYRCYVYYSTLTLVEDGDSTVDTDMGRVANYLTSLVHGFSTVLPLEPSLHSAAYISGID